MSLRAFNTALAIPNHSEILYNTATSTYWQDMVNMLNKAWEEDTEGRAHRAEHYYQGGNYYTYLFHYGLILANYIQSQVNGKDCAQIDIPTIEANIESMFKLSCVEKNLPCLSNKYGINLVQVWNTFKILFNIDCICQTTGIGQMIINLNGCTAFIVQRDIHNG